MCCFSHVYIVVRLYRCTVAKHGCPVKIIVLDVGTYWMTNRHNDHGNQEAEIKLNSVTL